jgi:integrase
VSVRKRVWTTSKGDAREAWLLDYRDAEGRRRFETFARKRDADAREAKVTVNISDGVHVPASKSPTVRQAGEDWIAAAARRLEKATVLQYRELLDLHIVPFLGAVKVAELTPATVRKFKDRLYDEGRSPAMVRKAVSALGSLIADAVEHGQAARNPVRELSRHKKQNGNGDRHEARLEVGKDIPKPEEVKAILASAKGRWRPLLTAAVFSGLRASELRGLRWADVDLKANELHVRQRADRYNEMGSPKSKGSRRTVPFGPFVANTLKQWKLNCPKGEADLVFPNQSGKVENLSNILQRGFMPAQVAAGVVTSEGKAKYTGLHALRHFYASWCINRTKDGGLGLDPKTVQTRLGHASITLTLDRYGHLFKGDDTEELAAAELRLVGA